MNVKRSWISWALFGAAVALIGCGGSGGGSTTSSTALTNGETNGGETNSGIVPGVITLTPSLSEISYGDQVTLNWNSERIQAISSSNFGATTLSGTYVDRPASDMTYLIRGSDAAEPHTGRVAQVTVRVTKTSKSYLVIGDMSTDTGAQVADYVRSVSSAVSVSPTLPATLTTDALVILPSANVSPSDRASVDAFLADGGAVIFVAEAPRKLATGDIREGDVSAISSWLGGAQRISWEYRWTSVADFAGFPVTSTALGQPAGNAYCVKPRPVSAIELTVAERGRDSCSAFAFQPAAGGRVFFAGGYGPTNIDTDKVQKALFLAGCRWATAE